MNEQPSDFALLREFVAERHQPAFATLAHRHLDLVYATALRKVNDVGGAEEIAQNVFSSLARKAWQFAPDDSLPAWLYKTALLESKFWLRGELRRRRREKTAAELGTTMKTPEDQPTFHALLPLLDEALLSLREKERTALLLRYYESQSLREVGVALRVSEDTAQKRVRSAVEKLSEFFRRHGFRTATVAATTAALQHTATCASTALMNSVVGAALQAAPPALVGLGALLARFASLSRAQTAAMSLLLVAMPMAWQVNERHGAAEDVRRIQTQLVAAQNARVAAQTELDRLRGILTRLQQSVMQANGAAARAAESAKAFDVWKKRIRSVLTADNYQWPDDSPFVRIPRSDLPDVWANNWGNWPLAQTGVIRSFARELMGLTPSERQSLEQTLQRLFESFEARRAGIYETNQPTGDPFPVTALDFKVIVSPGLGDDEEKQLKDQLYRDLRDSLGEERWPVLRQFAYNTVNDLSSRHEVRIWVENDRKGTPTIGVGFSGPLAGVGGGEALSKFLPSSDPNRTDGADDFLPLLPEALRQRALAWLQEQATARLGKEARR
jgi:RNA polymerase sigma factor (sigma-70 family)